MKLADARRVSMAWLLTGLGVVPTQAENLAPDLNEQVLRIPSTGLTEPELEVTVFRPPGDGPFPLVLVNHGRAPGLTKQQARYRPLLAAREMLRRGYAVIVPMREGYSRSGGAEINVGCNVDSNGRMQAQSVERTFVWLAQQPWADVSRHVVMGHGQGGLTTLAFGTRALAGTRLLVNVSGGLRQDLCMHWELSLKGAIAGYGKETRVPSLWFYGENDSYIKPEVWRTAFEAYVAAGGPAELHVFGDLGSGSYNLLHTQAGLRVWLPPVLAAMRRAGLPTSVVHGSPERPDIAPPASSGFAHLEDLDKLPVKSDAAREGYRRFLLAAFPRAFAVHPVKGNWSMTWGGDRPYAQALANCEKFAQSPCQLYAVDDTVVWSNP